MKLDTKKKILFLILFAVLVFIGNSINFSSLVGAEKQYFTLFQFFGPIAGAFLGPVVGVISVFIAEGADFIIAGKAFTLINLIRLLPMLFAVYYFGNYARKEKLSKIIMVLVPLVAIFLFIIHPIAGEAWYYSLYWLIPVLAVILPKWMPGKLLFKSLGATFTAHAVGSIAWLYAVPMTAEQWMGLIPVVAYERILFAVGIAGSFIVMNVVLDVVIEKFKLNIPLGALHIDKTYTLWLKTRVLKQ